MANDLCRVDFKAADVIQSALAGSLSFPTNGSNEVVMPASRGDAAVSLRRYSRNSAFGRSGIVYARGRVEPEWVLSMSSELL